MTRTEIAKGTDELMKTNAVVGEILKEAGQASEKGFDADSLLLRTKYAAFMYDDFIFRMRRLASRAAEEGTEAKKTGNRILAESFRTAVMQAEQMLIQAESGKRTVEGISDALKGLSLAARQGAAVDRTLRIRKFQDMLRKEAGSDEPQRIEIFKDERK